ncbi:hypothetical protein M422DRAFT_30205 [Sphaerobolus stellatus SS14]|uniref:Protein-S-isoprenylcysteine O-methyltransferase n=1 Tax=Sphaerobolus stellatus (strain SS14) TaxID=990650 RepID=A0A0C9W003_SPHS4|nr:hypothetical protein M422DRAFT_30205 [Sphaerobolus stellatus SS14]
MIPARLCLLVLSTRLLYLGNRPPHDPPTQGDKVTKKRIFDRYVRIMCHLFNTPFFLRVSFECIALLAAQFPSHAISCQDPQILKTLPLSLVIGTTFAASGAGLRLLCYRTLGRLYTYEITIRPRHKIVDSGPYGIVRHPAYTGGFLLYTGAVLLAVGPGSYLWELWECGLATSYIVIRIVMTVWTIFVIWFTYSLMARAPIEDKGLRLKFGKEWEAYAYRVPHRFIPGIY